jgi:HK97 gp10 family phage protein
MTFQNRDRMLAKLKKIQGAPRARLRGALEKNAEELTAMQKRMAPVASGALRDSIGFTFGDYAPANANVRGVSGGGGGDPDLSVTVHAGDARAWYAALVEFGTNPHENKGRFSGTQHPGAQASPYFYPSYRALKRRMKSRATREARKGIKEALA